MSRLWVQLSLGFAAVTLVSVLTVALLANLQADSTFRSYLAQSQLLASGLPEALGAAYARDGDWGAAAGIFSSYTAGGPGQHGQGMGQGMMGRGSVTFTLADAAGAVVYPAAGGQLSRGDIASATPVRAGDVLAGYLLASETPGAALSLAAQRFLSQINLAIAQAGLAAGLVGIVFGLLIARGLSAPLAHLAASARRIATGRLDERVPAGGPAELAAVGAAFNEMAAALEAAEGQRRRMVADIAHELRTPLSVIQGNLGAILDDVYPLSKAEVATIYDSTISLHRLVDDLRELSLAESGELRLRIEPTAMGPLIAQVAALFSEPAAARQIAVSVDLDPGLPDALADPERIRQVLTNFVANALRHSNAGGTITLRATKDEGRRMKDEGRAEQPFILHPSPFILIEVIDTGQGIAAEDLPHVFERFWRADRSRSRAQGGSGLGLAIARQIVQLHGGQIGVESEHGRGSRFWLSLPTAVGMDSKAVHSGQNNAGF
ncbi:HAMP domain-containing histidine kinase [Oscillochloris sp. ZM17-4]|uniref:sensor histidine kinase n=1 Tax=Oscillochloris sp. ZM17-4 TaxID=2866714 RepID=UPI001C72DEFE|nr:HAMP domain-containing sensor histidine kinase [Oscillochloris sp. ZM17-4]MBX0327770.1 HAMP domain-containing histidine kinase [Oscillochloris sp. ZM17-4]